MKISVLHPDICLAAFWTKKYSRWSYWSRGWTSWSLLGSSWEKRKFQAACICSHIIILISWDHAASYLWFFIPRKRQLGIQAHGCCCGRSPMHIIAGYREGPCQASEAIYQISIVVPWCGLVSIWPFLCSWVNDHETPGKAWFVWQQCIRHCPSFHYLWRFNLNISGMVILLNETRNVLPHEVMFFTVDGRKCCGFHVTCIFW